ncbi:MAG: DNA replication and repair protein RecF [Saprospiraceae bacterium]|nr:DNA replication and repair protein RecF [Saprospiraceae bacterium]
MHIKEIELANFKSYTKAHFDFSPRLNIIHGKNGVGKTNLLDAIYVLAMTKSNYTFTDSQLIKDGSDFYRLAGIVSKPEGDVSVVMKLAKGKKKIIERDQSVVPRPIEHIGLIPVVMITPDDLNLVNGSNIERRKLADATLSQIDPDYLRYLVQYNRILKQRNFLLKQGAEKRKIDLDLLLSYDRSMDEPAASIYQGRKRFFERMEVAVRHYYQILSDGRESVILKYISQLTGETMSSISLLNRDRDLASGRTNHGVHRDIVNCLIDQKDARIFGSQGQKKSLVFALKLAQLDYMHSNLEDMPILLLDDIFDRLDQDRVKHLLSIILSDTFGQIFITDTQLSRIQSILEDYPIPSTQIEIS